MLFASPHVSVLGSIAQPAVLNGVASQHPQEVSLEFRRKGWNDLANR
jgi:hypothetical protein